MNKIHYFSDGAPQQFKNKHAFMNLIFHERDFGIPAFWHFFPTAHGKTDSGGLGGSFKRNARRFSLQTGAINPITNAVKLYEWAKSNEKKVTVEYVSDLELENLKTMLEQRYTKALTIDGTKKFHCFIPDKKNYLKCTS